MNYRPYPDADRALAQVERGRLPKTPQPGPLNPFTATGRDLGEAFRAAFGHPRRAGKSAITAAIVDQAVKAGEHVHVATRRGVRCAGGAEQLLVLARVVRTCVAVPSQWNAWTVDGQYLYLRYRSGIGTVDAYDIEDSDAWTRIPDGAVARFDTGDPLDGEMDIEEFCQRASLQLADDAEVTSK